MVLVPAGDRGQSVSDVRIRNEGTQILDERDDLSIRADRMDCRVSRRTIRNRDGHQRLKVSRRPDDSQRLRKTREARLEVSGNTVVAAHEPERVGAAAGVIDLLYIVVTVRDIDRVSGDSDAAAGLRAAGIRLRRRFAGAIFPDDLVGQRPREPRRATVGAHHRWSSVVNELQRVRAVHVPRLARAVVGGVGPNGSVARAGMKVVDLRVRRQEVVIERHTEIYVRRRAVWIDRRDGRPWAAR